MVTSKRLLLASFLASLITIFVFLPSLHNDFVNWDDNDYIYENRRIQTFDSGSIQWMFTSFHAHNWHPLTWLSHSIDYAIWGLNPFGHHLTSVILHGLNTFLVIMIIARLTGLKSENSYSQERPLVAGVITGLLFGLHPLHVESVTWVSERKDVLYAFFFLMSILSYIRYTSSPKRSIISYVVCLVMFILSLMSKPMAVTLPLVLILLDFYPLERVHVKNVFTSGRKIIIEKVPFFGLSLVSILLTLMAQQDAIRPFDTFPLITRILTAFWALFFYLYKVLLPMNLAPLYPYSPRVSLYAVEYAASFIAFLVLTFFCCYVWRKQKIWASIWAYYLITLFPVLGFIQVGNQAAADRYTYLPSLAPFLLAGLGSAHVFGKLYKKENKKAFKKIAALTVVVTLVFVTLIFVTVQQEKLWKDSITLWEHEIRLFPFMSYQAHNHLGVAYKSKGLFDKSIRQFKIAILLNPYSKNPYLNLGIAYQAKGLLSKAAEQYKKVITYDSSIPAPYYHLGTAYEEMGLIDDAIEQYRSALRRDIYYARAHVSLGSAYTKKGMVQKANEHYKLAYTLDPFLLKGKQ